VVGAVVDPLTGATQIPLSGAPGGTIAPTGLGSVPGVGAVIDPLTGVLQIPLSGAPGGTIAPTGLASMPAVGAVGNPLTGATAAPLVRVRQLRGWHVTAGSG
jgi:hypothetical protein